MTIEPDTKDWTWVLERPCPDCGFDAAALDRDRVPQAIRDNATLWQVVLIDDDAAVRPSSTVWSPLEYACHVRDVNVLFDERVRSMLTRDASRFADWDQDATAAEQDYGSQDPAAVADAVTEVAETVAATYESVTGDRWQRTGTRSDGSEFTVDTLARYHLHDLVHHAHDVSHVTKRVTVASYDAYAEAYRAGTDGMGEVMQPQVDGFAARLPAGARVLEVGSGAGRDARALEAAGLSVRRTDITPAFVRMLRADGFDADVLDPLTSDLADPTRDTSYDGVWASASLLHVRREDLPLVMSRLAAATRPDGVLQLDLKEGDGARFSTHGHVGAPRHFTYWREGPLRSLLEAAGWRVEAMAHGDGVRGDRWLQVEARRA